MDLTRYVDDLQHRLATAAGAGGDDARELALRLTAPLDAAVRLVLLDALSAAAAEISAELAPGAVDVRLRAGEPEFVVAVPAPVAAPVPTGTSPVGTSPAAAPDADAAATTRTTLRLPDHLKSQVEVAAAHDGVSVNTWLVRTVAAALDLPPGRSAPQAAPGQRSGDRVTGWVR
ncbi:toxin-antitoxin system HicB family antitoxin [Cellulomonas shaoxiangyii]|uniref:Toxin-antitoxin system HicB family antitoxin n=1 Tax=Cellulomonas shaoxiangyii TaxID=2566013 RepID=A0A4P7SHE3_9CELL|nr:toxin-antitoxin system HicB family antitoxin [Cellulomonas shaoxiangyii]QCB93088.1 toxin-antitoxin system HicB family antitoxin [Cellulomonas shaoxiangyii]TGY84882.1 toxin-antitoxin system HicB family antitoxin [Cellulomonas shaoxiangyii]